ncbi:MAG: hypothetical protein K1X83_15425 [Oligoflexia bacterium]|nr:hypothetical protein [Oligoflexia bacterium]
MLPLFQLAEISTNLVPSKVAVESDIRLILDNKIEKIDYAIGDENGRTSPALTFTDRKAIIRQAANDLKGHLDKVCNKAGLTSAEKELLINSIPAIPAGLKALEQLGKKVDAMKPAELRSAAAQFYSQHKDLLPTIDRLLAVDFGILNLNRDLWGSSSPGYHDFGTNGCGPTALFALLFISGAIDKNPKSKETKEVVAKVISECDAGIFGTIPSNLEVAASSVTEGRYSLRRHTFTKETELADFVADHQPCLVKFGTGIFNQHYDTIVGKKKVDGLNIYNTVGGLMFPESQLIRLMAQKPFANTVWTLEKAAVLPQAVTKK